KYAIDALLVWRFAGIVWTPLNYLSPLLTTRQALLRGAPAWLLPLVAVIALPFLWIGVSMTMRRAVDAGASPWVALLFFVPGLNLVLMLALCLPPSRPRGISTTQSAVADDRFKSAMLGVGASLAITFLSIAVAVYLRRRYSAGLFLGVEPHRAPPSHEVVTVVEIAALPDVVWRHVVTFPDLPPPTEVLFRAGVAAPLRARIEGHGVGAVRYCDFTTGSFVEPITAWDENRLLAFDIIAQAPPMTEWSPYRNVNPPHLDGYFRATHGEFRLTPLPGGRTRLEGRTAYVVDMFPQRYWTLQAGR